MSENDNLFMHLLAIESSASRLEGAFAADPGLGMMWRSQAALTEACRSVSLEDIHIFEGDVIARNIENRLTDMEGARGTQIVNSILRVMIAPGDLLADPEPVLHRCWRAGRLIEDATAPEFGPLAEKIRKDLLDAPCPLFGAIKAASRFRLESESQSPAAERLVFMAADHAMRRQAPRYEREATSSIASDLIRSIRADWCLLPSIALTQDGFRTWSPVGQKGLANLLDGLRLEAGRSLGSLALLRRWREAAIKACEGRGGRSRMTDLVAFLEGSPIVTPGMVARGLGVTERTGLNLMNEAVASGMLRCITGRRSWRVWATPLMADRIRSRINRHQGAVLRHSPATLLEIADGALYPEIHSPARPPVRAEIDAAADAAMAGLDEAMASADAVLAKYRRTP